jgi:signal transduction histidine kinase/CheY-like chemotaxis protein
VLGLHFTAFGLVIGGIVPPPDPGMWDPRIPAVWLRHGVILAMLGIIVAAMELYVVEQLAHQVDVHRELAGHEMRQRQSLEQAEREREHERAQREHAQHALEQARRLEALGRISGGIAHDFNNALTVIMGTADVARLSVPPDGEVAHYLGEIIEASRRAADLTSQLMTLGRQHVASKRPVDMHPFLTHLQGALRRVLPDDITLVVDLPPTRLIAHADAAGLERALYNLVLNARDAMPRGGSIVVSCLAETVAGGTGPIADGTYVTLRIADTGHGMSAETLECIFDPFFTTKGDRGGTGLGLATVYAFATEARGEIDATSEPGVGTTFTLRLPISAEPESAGVVDSGTAAATAAARRQGRVLVVEDRDDVRLNIVRTLRVRGFEVQEAPDGDAAVDTLTAAPGFDLMCIDGVMPGLGTAEVIERARHLAPTMRVLLCSGHVREELLRRGVEAGRYAFLAKPFTSEELLDGVDAALRTPAPNVSPFPG